MWEYNHNTPTELYHYSVKGQKWGVRRYQYADGSLAPAGQKRYNAIKGPPIVNQKVSHVINKARTVATGRQYVDTYLKKGTTFSRIQTSDNFENFAFYATYKKADSNKYMGLFGKKLTSRANAEAKAAESKANKSGDVADIENA